MADAADIANELLDMSLDIALNQPRKESSRPTPDGACHNCGEDIELPRIFCGSDCARSYDAIMKTRGLA